MIRINNHISTIDELIDLLHDLWIDISTIEYNQQKAKIIFIVGKFVKSNIFNKKFTPLFNISVSPVFDYTLNDSEKVGTYDINKIIIKGNDLRIITGIPLVFEMKLADSYVIDVEYR
ncbi:hypothetical protein [Sedimentisphaera salicampi]|uniref:Uncharacterized protein n=1 Tax=Sedimentisphaera salicampi TaxID=1941349 RepID=A0A1W6LMJ8_9BACT|nr:hypothetical protein [Sedimentisphaera salicampi]ARN56999.1 hypothetical protein STSP1_01392 [Sedimentisphaera salicampi]